VVGRRLVVGVLLVVAAGCGPGAAEPRPVDDEVSAAPTELDVDGALLTLGVYAWRDVQPGVAPDAPCARLCINATIDAVRGQQLPDIEVTEIAAVVGDAQAGFDELDVAGTGLGPSQYEFTARGGPAVETGDTFDLVVRIDLADGEALLRARDVPVVPTG
jgi:hypothetical protein